VNELALSATVLEASPLRYTPGGVPVLQLQLVHAGSVVEAGTPRQVELTLPAVALGDLALMLADLSLGVSLSVKGFLAASRKGSSRVVLHLQQVERLTSAETAVTV